MQLGRIELSEYHVMGTPQRKSIDDTYQRPGYQVKNSREDLSLHPKDVDVYKALTELVSEAGF